MSFQIFSIDQYQAWQVALNSPGFPEIYGFIQLYWGQHPVYGARATLWYYRDSAVTIQTNLSFNSGGVQRYYAFFRQAQFHDSIDLLRNEKPTFFHWNDTAKSAFLATRSEPVGEEEKPAP